MTDRPERDNLLPGDATPLERAIADTDGRLDDIDMDLVRRVGGPVIAEVPAAYLPHRAWGRSVDVWDPAWPEQVQRDVIDAAPAVHAHKGALDAVQRALAALQVDAEVIEWWQTVPRGPAYTFKVRAFARARLYDGPVLDARHVGAIFSSVLRAKPLSRAFSLAVAVSLPSKLGLAPVAATRTRVAMAANCVLAIPDAVSRLGLVPVVAVRTRVSLAAHCQVPA